LGEEGFQHPDKTRKVFVMNWGEGNKDNVYINISDVIRSENIEALKKAHQPNGRSGIPPRRSKQRSADAAKGQRDGLRLSPTAW
jgi:hypothetical protein